MSKVFGCHILAILMLELYDMDVFASVLLVLAIITLACCAFLTLMPKTNKQTGPVS